MRKLIWFVNVSLDGFIEKPDHSLDWSVVDEELHRYINILESEIGTDVYGRRMYETMQAYWPTADTTSDLDYVQEFSRIWKNIPKLVFSSTLKQVEGNARLVQGDPVEVVRRLKEQPGKPIEMGGRELASALLRAGLVDEYRIFIHPVLLGAGTRMTPDLSADITLKLVETHTFSSGVVFLHYQRQA